MYNPDVQNVIHESLLSCFPEECEIAGPTTVREIASGPTNIETIEGGSNVNFAEIISVLVGCSSLIYHAIEIHQKWPKNASRNDRANFVRTALLNPQGTAEASSSQITPVTLTSEQVDEIVALILTRISP